MPFQVYWIMALKTGDTAPVFNLKSTGEKSIDSSRDLKGKAFILYFYPKDFTRGCTAEACTFRDQFEAFRDLDVPVLGISKDDIETHERFKKEHKLPFDLLSDPTGQVCKAYDALIPLLKMPKRITYLIDKGHKVAAVFSDMFETKGHIYSMLKSLEK